MPKYQNSLFVILFPIKNELFQKFGNNQITLTETINSNDMMIQTNFPNGDRCIQQSFGQITQNKDGDWELVGVNYDIFKDVLEYWKKRKSEKEVEIVLN